MRYEFWLGWRYLFARRRERFISMIAVLSIGGVALGVASLLVVLAVMSGFDYDIKEKLIGTNAHLVVDTPRGVSQPQQIVRRLASMDHVVGVSPFVAGQAILRLPGRAFGVLVRGVDVERERRVTRLANYLVAGRWPAADGELLIGSELGAFLDKGLGDRLTLISPADGGSHELAVCGIFRSGMYEYDAHLVVVTLAKGQQIYGLDGMVSGIGVKLDALEQAPAMKSRIQTALGPSYGVKTWMDLNQTLFEALRLEKMTMFVILTLIILVAAANIISTLLMMVTERTRDIGILKAIGATDGSIRLLFTWEGLLVGGLGIAAGAALAAAAIWALGTFEFIKLPSTIYYLDHLPVRVVWADWWKTITAALAITWGATVYPARQAARFIPVDALRYE